jgi:preprotein translocase subunit SecF
MGRFSDLGNALYSGEKSFDFIGKRRIWYIAAAVLVLLSIILPLARGFSFGIEFRGGSEFRVTSAASQGTTLAEEAVQSVLPDSEPLISIIGADDLRIQTEKITDVQAEGVRTELASAYGVESSAVSSSFIGPSWGQEITGKAITGLVWFVVLAAILMGLYFRTIKMSMAAVLALLHDLIVTAGVYGALGFEVTPAAVIGFLTILGYSLYDTVVVFDKIRENTFEVEHSDTATFAERVNLAINQTLVRSINTSVVAVLPVAAILFIGSVFLGAGTLRDIALALFIGIIVGTYSTIFIAAPAYSHLREGEAIYAAAAKKVLANR